MRIVKAIADFSACYKAEQRMSGGAPEGIIVHSTGANNPNLRRYVNLPELCGVNPYDNFFGGENSNDVTPHGIIGKDKDGNVTAVQILPLNFCCWCCGRGAKGSYNFEPAYIQFEIAEDGLKNEVYFEEAFGAMAEVCAQIMREFPNIKLENVISHKEAAARGYASGHGDPEHWLRKFGKDMKWFRGKVEKCLKPENVKGASEFKVGDVVLFKGRTHYTSSKGTVGTAAKAGKAKITNIAAGAAHPYHVVHTDGGSNVYGWVDLADIEKIRDGEAAKDKVRGKKPIDEIAREVIEGKWGNGEERKKRLTAAGYDCGEVQAKVNALMCY